ncbi:NrdH-redoxin [Patescibacteria group bacterium]|nr:NrdH-redoxin [Patescibacteria group bacterium]MBU4116102.1 NrdH-redoxin [Patescibacteria group bacterium]
MENQNNKKVFIYSTPMCPYCEVAKDFFDENKVEYINHDVSTDVEKRREMIEMTGQMGVPVIVVDEQAIVGFDEDKLNELLGL